MKRGAVGAAEAGAVGGRRTAPHAHHAMPRRIPHDLPLHTLTALRPHVASLARMGCQYQSDMGPIASAYDAFARRWNTAENVRRDAQGFRDEANVVLRRVFERMQREDHDFYPRIEEEEATACH